MEENTEIIKKNTENSDSKIANVSLRGWISVIVITTVCVMSGLQIEVKEPLYTLAGLVVGFYFGQNQKKNV
jgi:hypothetical protein